MSLFSIGHDLYLQKTRLGVVVGGTVSRPSLGSEACYATNLKSQLDRFWAFEEVTLNTTKFKEEEACEAHFTRTVSRDNFERYIVRLPFREIKQRLGGSRTVALRRLSALEWRFQADTTLRTEHTRIIEEYLKLNYLSEVTDPDDHWYYMPHHAVTKESNNTTKVCIVFDASVKSDAGISLNDMLLVDPIIQDKLFTHLIRFRTYKYVITADIKGCICKYDYTKMIDDINRFYGDGELITLQFNTLTFGVSSSPFLAICVLQKLVDFPGQLRLSRRIFM